MKIELEKISVVIPTLNRCFTLPRAIESVLRQTLMPCEVIVVDNGSSDGTLELIKSKYPTVRILHEKKIGVSAARNRGIKAAQGSWVALLDSDDEWLPNKLQRQIEGYINCGESVRVIHTNEHWRKNNLLVNQMKKHQTQRNLKKKQKKLLPKKLKKKKKIQKNKLKMKSRLQRMVMKLIQNDFILQISHIALMSSV